MSHMKTSPDKKRSSEDALQISEETGTAATISASSEKTKKSAPKLKGAGFCCYVGPSILGVIQQNQIFDGDVVNTRKMLASAIEKRPGIAALIVDGNDLAEALRAVRTPGSLLYEKYHKMIGR